MRGDLRARRGLIEFVAAATFVAVVAVSAHAGSIERMGVQRLRDELPAGSAIVIEPTTDAVEAMRGLDLPLAGLERGPGEAARAWMFERARAFGLDPDVDALVPERVETIRGGAHRVLLRQTWRGVPVEGGDARLVISAAGRLRAVAANFRSGLAASEAPRVSRAEAITRSARDLGVSLARELAEAELRVRRGSDGDHLAWRVQVELADGRPARCWVDATSGAVLALDEGCARAVGLVYPTDPRMPLAEVPLPRLGSDPGPGLRNAWFRVEDQLQPLVSPLGPDGDYRYAPTDGGFEQVNAYWHADRFLHDHLGGLGYEGPPESLIVRVNAAIDPNVALTSGRYVYLGRPIAGFAREPARANDIVYHELTHAVLYGKGIQPGGDRREAGAMHEALADLFAAAYTEDPAIGEWLYLTFPNGVTRVDQPIDPWNMSHYDRVSFAGAPGGSTWANGMILSSALWDVRAVIGVACDSIVFEALDYLPSLPSWAHLANALLQADEDFHARRYHEAFVTAFSNRGIRGTVTMPARIAGPSTLEPGASGRFTADPCCGVQQVYEWSVRSWCRGLPCGEWRSLGSGPELTTSFDEDSELRLQTSTGWGASLDATRFVSVRAPQLVVEGPRSVAVGHEATWTARVAAMAPLHVTWQRAWQGVPGWSYLGEGMTASFAVVRPCTLEVEVLDGLLRITREYVEVGTFVDQPPPENHSVLQVHQRGDARAHAMETTVDLPRTGPLRMRVFDVRGRLRASLWEGPATRGGHVVRWDATGLEPGVYLLRVEAEPTGTVLRFVIVR